jgi:hypothetical protein
MTAATLVLIAAAAGAALLALGAKGASRQTCGKVNPAEIRAAGDPAYAKKLEQLARCRVQIPPPPVAR